MVYNMLGIFFFLILLFMFDGLLAQKYEKWFIVCFIFCID